MFQFPAFAPDGLYIHPPVPTSACTVTVGFPIRKSQDQCSFDNSPGLIAAYHVLHRLITPRHPPCTLNSLITFITSPASQNKFRKTKTRNKYPKPLPALKVLLAKQQASYPLACRAELGEPQSLLPICDCQRAVLMHCLDTSPIGPVSPVPTYIKYFQAVQGFSGIN